MNIIYLLNTSSMSAGSSKSFLRIIEEIRFRHNVLVISPEEGGILDTLSNMGIEVMVLPYIFNMRPYTTTLKDKLIFPARWLRLKVLNYLTSRKLDKIAKSFKVDLFHANTSVTEIGWLSSRRLHVPHLTHIREYGLKDHKMHILGLKTRLQDKDNYFIAITQDILAYHGLLNNPRACVIYNPIVGDEAEFCFDWPKARYILYAGRINRTKGIEDLIDAYIIYAKDHPQPLRLLIAGSYSGARYERIVKECNHKLEKSGVRSYVDWLGERRDVNTLMRHSLLVVVPSLFEGFGRVMPEAMANGALVAARDTGGSAEQFTNGKILTGNPIGLPFKDVAGMVETFRQSESMTEKEYKEYVDLAQETVKHYYTKDVSVRKVLEVYEKIENQRNQKGYKN